MLIAITGGIGSGKSAAAAYFKSKGYPVFSADAVYSELLEKDAMLFAALKKEFGSEVETHGKLDRKVLAQKVFCDQEKLKALNRITHPKVMEEIFRRAAGHPVAFAEVPLLYESGFETSFDLVLLVTAPKDMRAKRAAVRDGTSVYEIEKRMQSQMSDAEKTRKGGYVVENDSEIEHLESQLDIFLQRNHLPIQIESGDT